MFNLKNLPVAIALATSVLAHDCHKGADEKAYTDGVEQAHLQYDKAWSFVNEKCSSVEAVYEQLVAAGPGDSAPPCQVDGFKTGLNEAKAAAHEDCPVLPDGCTNEATYKAGAAQAKQQFESSMEFAGCKKIDKVMQITSESGPTEPPCLQMGFQDQLYLSYVAAGEECGGTTCTSRAETMAEKEWQATVEKIGDTCASADQVLTQTLGVAPATPKCLNEAYNHKIQALYDSKFDDCQSSPSPSPKPDPKCKEDGKALGEDAWTKARRQVGDTCHDIDEAFATVTAGAPKAPPCKYDSYMDAVSELYETAQETCINECEGYGETRGQNAADQFCRVTALFADDEMSDGVTLYVCNEKEKKACYDAFHARVEETSECPERVENADTETEEFYNSVQEVCQISIGADQ